MIFKLLVLSLLSQVIPVNIAIYGLAFTRTFLLVIFVQRYGYQECLFGNYSAIKLTARNVR